MLPERAVDALDHRQRGVRTDLVAAVVVVGEIGDREIRQSAFGPRGRTASPPSTRRPCRSGGAGPPGPASLWPTEAHRTRRSRPGRAATGPSTVSVSGTPGSSAISHGTLTLCGDAAAEDEIVDAGGRRPVRSIISNSVGAVRRSPFSRSRKSRRNCPNPSSRSPRSRRRSTRPSSGRASIP